VAKRSLACLAGMSTRVVQLDAGAAAVMDAWRRARAQRVREPGPLLCTWRGGGLDGSYVRRELRAIALRAGVREPVSPEVLRRSLAAELAGEGYSLSDIRAELGQANLRSAAAYLPDAAPGPDAPTRLAQQLWPGRPADVRPESR
jgi:site-specific recombinase XerD